MNKILRVHAACLLAGVLCCSGSWAASSSAAFEQLVDDFVFGTLALSPTTATGYGYHVHNDTSLDDLLDDFSPAGIAASESFLHDMEGRIAKLDTASLDAEQKAHVNRMNKVRELIRQAEANLQDSPEVWSRVAREENEGNIGLIDSTLREGCPSGERMRYDQAAVAAEAALNEFNRWLEDHLAERVSDWRLGKERYGKKFRLAP